MTELSDGIKARARKQIEFYFSDSNLPRDSFLLSAVEEAPDGFVSLGLICTFSRMQQLLKLGGEDAKLAAADVPEHVLKGVAAALADSQLLTVSEDGTRIKRTQELNAEQAMQDIEERSLYATPFPHDTSLDDLMALFSEHAPVNSVRMRRHLNSKDFRGSVFVEFATKEDAEKVMKMRIEHAGAVIQMEPKADYVTRKKEERHAKPGSPHNPANANGTAAAQTDAKPAAEPAAVAAALAAGGKAAAAAAAGSDAAKPAGDAQASAAEPAADAVAAPKVAAAPAAASAAPAAAAPAAAPATASAAGDKGGDYDVARNTFVSVKVEGEGSSSLGFHTIREFFGARDGGVKFVNFKPGDTEGFVRFDSAESAERGLARADADGTIQLGQGDAKRAAKIALITGDEEQALVDKAAAQFKAAAERGHEGGGRGGGRGGRGRGSGRVGGRGGGRGRGRKRAHDDDGGGRGKKQRQ